MSLCLFYCSIGQIISTSMSLRLNTTGSINQSIIDSYDDEATSYTISIIGQSFPVINIVNK